MKIDDTFKGLIALDKLCFVSRLRDNGEFEEESSYLLTSLSLSKNTKEEREAVVSIDLSDKWSKISSFKRQKIAFHNQTTNRTPESKITESDPENELTKTKKPVRFSDENVS